MSDTSEEEMDHVEELANKLRISGKLSERILSASRKLQIRSGIPFDSEDPLAPPMAARMTSMHETPFWQYVSSDYSDESSVIFSGPRQPHTRGRPRTGDTEYISPRTMSAPADLERGFMSQPLSIASPPATNFHLSLRGGASGSSKKSKISKDKEPRVPQSIWWAAGGWNRAPPIAELRERRERELSKGRSGRFWNNDMKLTQYYHPDGVTKYEQDILDQYKKYKKAALDEDERRGVVAAVRRGEFDPRQMDGMRAPQWTEGNIPKLERGVAMAPGASLRGGGAFGELPMPPFEGAPGQNVFPSGQANGGPTNGPNGGAGGPARRLTGARTSGSRGNSSGSHGNRSGSGTNRSGSAHSQVHSEVSGSGLG